MNRAQFMVLAVLIVCSGVLGYATLSRGHDWGDDFATYIMQAKSIADGHPSRFIEANRFTVENSTNFTFPIAAPWGTPLLLAPLYRHFGLNMLALKSLNLACYVLFLTALVFLLRGRHSFAVLVLLVSFFAFNPTLLASLEGILSDMPFLLVSTASVLLMGRIAVEGRPLFGKARDGVLLGALFAAAFFIRTNGALLLATLFGIQVVKLVQAATSREGRAEAAGGTAEGSGSRTGRLRLVVSRALRSERRGVFIGVLPYIVFVVLALIWSAVFPQGGSSHVRVLESFSLATIRHNLRFYATIPADFFIGVPHHHVWYVASLPFLVAGMLTGARRDYHFILYMFLTAVLYLFWPATQGVRYVIPLLPFYLHFVFVGGRWGYEALGNPWRRGVQAAAVCALMLVALFFVKGSVSQAAVNMRNDRMVSSGPYAPASQEMFRYITEDTGKDAVIVFFKPRLMRMMTGRASIRIDDTAELARGDYLCYYIMEKPYGQISLGDVMRLLGEGRLIQIYANPDFRVYRIVHSVGTA